MSLAIPPSDACLLDVPHDVVLKCIFSQLSLQGVACMARTCKRYAAIASEPCIWRDFADRAFGDCTASLDNHVSLRDMMAASSRSPNIALAQHLGQQLRCAVVGPCSQAQSPRGVPKVMTRSPVQVQRAAARPVFQDRCDRESALWGTCLSTPPRLSDRPAAALLWL